MRPIPSETVIVSFKTAEYLAVLLGQNLWGNPVRAREAAAELAQAMGSRRMTTSLECFSDPDQQTRRR